MYDLTHKLMCSGKAGREMMSRICFPLRCGTPRRSWSPCALACPARVTREFFLLLECSLVHISTKPLDPVGVTVAPPQRTLASWIKKFIPFCYVIVKINEAIFYGVV